MAEVFRVSLGGLDDGLAHPSGSPQFDYARRMTDQTVIVGDL
jgi:hypothetical protein